ncbi:MAG: phosphoribosyl-ATP diphosphatase [Methanomicrobiales archaeon]|nr:phosphoribosyl-ATP diphosphatase [Methanomicrobiales archaeon]NYT21210.1 phosphoribosyl-ATP diphosphatase [Methanomicrobiales archaeon]
MSGRSVLEELWAVITDRFDHPSPESYVSRLVSGEKGTDRALEKVGEETTEFIIAVKNEDHARTVSEAADLQFHFMVALKAAGVEFSEILDELAKRRR